MNNQVCLPAAAAGCCAYDTLNHEAHASVCGNTSKGIFAVTASKKVLFITPLPFKGPLTINTHEDISAYLENTRDDYILLSPRRIEFHPSGLQILINSRTQIWTPPHLDMMDFDLKALINRCRQIAKEFPSQHPHQPLDSRLKSSPKTSGIPEEGQRVFPIGSNSLLPCLTAGDESALFNTLSGLLGRGEGLTPSGDDFICGFMLAASIWGERLYPDFTLQKTIQKTTRAARRTTTALSASLIACAASSSADERILTCLHWLANGGKTAVHIKEELQSYGSSSGFDTLAGMLACIQSSRIVQQAP